MLDQAFAEFADIGFTAVKADVPEGMTADEYVGWISSYGLTPSLSLFSSPFDETVDITDEMERAKRFAGAQVALGLDHDGLRDLGFHQNGRTGRRRRFR